MEDQILVALRRIIRATDLHSRRLLRDFGITGPQLLVLRSVAAAGELSGSALAQTLSVSLPTASDIVGRLNARGLVSRRRNHSDKRQVLVSVTDKGRRILEAAPPPLQESFSTELAGLQEWEQTQMLAVLQRIVGMMEAQTLDASPVLTAEELIPPGRVAYADAAKGPAPAADEMVETSG